MTSAINADLDPFGPALCVGRDTAGYGVVQGRRRGRMSPASTAQAVRMHGSQSRTEKDRRWPAVLRKLKGLRKHGRRSIRIVDTDCGPGELLIRAARQARELGFVAIEGRGIDSDPRQIARARRSAARQTDPAIGLVFEPGEIDRVMREESEFPADLLLCGRDEHFFAVSARAAGGTVLWDRAEKPVGDRS